MPSRISPPSSNARSGAAELTPPGAFLISLAPTSSAAPKPSTRVNEVEDADEPDRPDDRATGLARGRHRVEAHEHVRQTRRAEHERHRERDEVDGVLVLQSRLEQVLAARVLRGRRGVAEQRREAEAELAEHPDRHDRGADDEQHGLDDLHPGRALHAAVDDVEDHQDADDDDDEPLADRALDAEQEGHETAGSRHLGEQVEERDDERRDRCRDAHRALAQPEAEHVRHRVLADVAEQLRDEEQGDEPGDEEADGVEEPVVAVDGDGARDAEERGRREVVAGDGDAVLAAREGTAAGVVLGRTAVVARGPDDDREGDDDEEGEDADVDRRVAHRRRSGRDRGDERRGRVRSALTARLPSSGRGSTWPSPKARRSRQPMTASSPTRVTSSRATAIWC